MRHHSGWDDFKKQSDLTLKEIISVHEVDKATHKPLRGQSVNIDIVDCLCRRYAACGGSETF